MTDFQDLLQDHGLKIDRDAVYLDIYRLIVIFRSRKRMPSFDSQQRPLNLHQVVTRFEESEATRLLINIAVVCRSVLDYSAPYDGSSVEGAGEVVGWLRKTRDSTQGTLSFREACNKVIHAFGVALVREKGVSEPGDLVGEIQLTGEKGKNRWIASLDVLAFAQSAYDLL